MSELALYRKYRPQKWDEIIGQEPVVQVLRGATALGHITHAYLFAGSRGTGKTSVARILARAVGCTDKDLYEIDAASNRGIDEIRELREAVRTLPFESPYKVYIIDEAHMLTKEAFNALLKTLEEPPKHVIFILATTETHKLPETIVSRCQTFSFAKPSTETLKQVVLAIAKKEKFSLDEEGAKLIALLGDGSFRDTIGILQKVISASDDRKITRAEIEALTGAPRRQAVYDLLSALMNKDTKAALRAIGQVAAIGQDLKLFTKLAAALVRAAMLVKYAPDLEKEIVAELDTDDERQVLALKNHPNADHLSVLLKELLFTYDELSRSFLPEAPLQILAVKLGQ